MPILCCFMLIIYAEPQRIRKNSTAFARGRNNQSSTLAKALQAPVTHTKGSILCASFFHFFRDFYPLLDQKSAFKKTFPHPIDTLFRVCYTDLTD